MDKDNKKQGDAKEDRRHFQRVSFDAPVMVHQMDRHALTEVIDISLKGILIKGDLEHFNKKDDVHILIKLADDAHIDMTAKWVHQDGQTSAFHWTHLDIESVTHLRRLIELNTGDEFGVRDELDRLDSNPHI